MSLLSQEELLKWSKCGNQEDLIIWLKDRKVPFTYTAKDSIVTTRDLFDTAIHTYDAFHYEEPVEDDVYYFEPSTGKTTGWIYVIQMGECGPIKIGYSGEKGGARSRLSQLQIGNPYPLKFLWMANGNWGIESKIHKLLSHHRMKGEWFFPNPEVLEFLDSAKSIGFYDAVKQFN